MAERRRAISRLKDFVLFWYDFIVGDDWVIAAGVVLAVIATNRLVAAGVDAWWLLPVAVVGLLGVSLWRGTRT